MTGRGSARPRTRAAFASRMFLKLCGRLPFCFRTLAHISRNNQTLADIFGGKSLAEPEITPNFGKLGLRAGPDRPQTSRRKLAEIDPKFVPNSPEIGRNSA